MPDGDRTDDLSRRQIRAQERFRRRPEDFQTLIQAEPVPVPFAWDTPASRAFLKALMEEQEALNAWMSKPWTPFGENTTEAPLYRVALLCLPCRREGLATPQTVVGAT